MDDPLCSGTQNTFCTCFAHESMKKLHSKVRYFSKIIEKVQDSFECLYYLGYKLCSSPLRHRIRVEAFRGN